MDVGLNPSSLLVIMPKETPRTQDSIKRILVLVSGVSFISSSVFFIIKLLTTPSPNSPSPEQTQSVTDQLKAQEQGYLIVLEREPENTSALQGLVEVRLKLNDLEGAIAPLEKLITIYPDDESIKMLLATVRQQIASEQPNQPQE